MRRTKRQLLEGEVLENVKNSKLIDNNTLEIYYKNGDRVIRLHNTNIITFKKNGDIILTSGGWKTLTTKDRLNKYSPLHITQKNYIWNVSNSFIGKGFNFYDGITFDKNRKLKTKIKNINNKKINKVKKDIKKYVNLIDKLDKLPQPSNGDCWDCLFRTKEGQIMGDLSDSDHLKLHIKEGYIFGSILVNAMKEYGYRDSQIGFHYSMNIKDTFKRALTKYLQKKLLKEVI